MNMGATKTAETRTKFKTRWYHRHPKYWFRKDRLRPKGFRTVPEVVRFSPAPGVTPNAKAPVRIFLGTEPLQARAERVFLWSVYKHRDPSRVYEIYLMKDLVGYDRAAWTTGFTNYRYAIPALAGEEGRAIYNDVDQIYLSDPAQIFDLEMNGAGILCIERDETSVSLIDCARMARHWRLEEAQKPLKRKHFLEIIAREDLWGRLPAEWNARDNEFSSGEAKCFHYTTLRTQPWRPFPDQLKYEDHPDGAVWFELEQSSNAARFTAFTRECPSRQFSTALERSGSGTSEHRRAVKDLLALSKSLRPASVLVLSPRGDLDLEIGSASSETISFGEVLRAGSNRRADGVICLGGVQDLPEDDVPWALDALFEAAGGFVHVFVSLDAKDPAFASALPPQWWALQLQLASNRASGRAWRLTTSSGAKTSVFSS